MTDASKVGLCTSSTKWLELTAGNWNIGRQCGPKLTRELKSKREKTQNKIQLPVKLISLWDNLLFPCGTTYRGYFYLISPWVNQTYRINRISLWAFNILIEKNIWHTWKILFPVVFRFKSKVLDWNCIIIATPSRALLLGSLLLIWALYGEEHHEQLNHSTRVEEPCRDSREVGPMRVSMWKESRRGRRPSKGMPKDTKGEGQRKRWIHHRVLGGRLIGEGYYLSSGDMPQWEPSGKSSRWVGWRSTAREINDKTEK